MRAAFGIAGEIGHIGVNFNGMKNVYGERGTLEYYASSESVRQYVRERLNDYPTSNLSAHSTYQEILQAYYDRDPLATWAFDLLAWRLAYGLLSTFFILNPNKIVIGSDYPASEEFVIKSGSPSRQWYILRFQAEWIFAIQKSMMIRRYLGDITLF